MSKQGWHIFISKAHKWIGLILGIQLLLWTVGGIVMSWIPIEQVRGEHKIAAQPPVMLTDTARFLPLQELASPGQTLTNARYTSMLGKPVAKLTYSDKSVELRNAVTGQLLSPISANLAMQIAEADFAPQAEIAAVEQVNSPSVDYRGPFPVWKITFADAENSSLYVSPTEGRVVSRRSSIWRFYDFFWMLHIMDYDERHDFNNPLIMTTSLFASLFALSGFCLLYFRLNRRDFTFILGKAKKARR